MPTVTINRTECTSCSTCWSTCPDVFEEDTDEGMSRIVEKYRKGGDQATGAIPDEQVPCSKGGGRYLPGVYHHIIQLRRE